MFIIIKMKIENKDICNNFKYNNIIKYSKNNFIFINNIFDNNYHTDNNEDNNRSNNKIIILIILKIKNNKFN